MGKKQKRQIKEMQREIDNLRQRVEWLEAQQQQRFIVGTSSTETITFPPAEGRFPWNELPINAKPFEVTCSN